MRHASRLSALRSGFVTRRLAPTALAAAACLIAAPAFANAAAASREFPFEELPQPDMDNVFDGDYVIVAIGGGYVPDYSGADEYDIGYGGAVRGEVGGIGFATRGLGLELDWSPDIPGPVGVSFGPDIRYKRSRSGSVKDEVVDLLPRLDKTVELGFGAGVSVRNVLTPVDSISLSGGTRWDVSGQGAGQSASLSLSYFTALSQSMGAGLSLSTGWADGEYADYYWSITPEASAATGGQLPVYDAKGGFKDVGAWVYGGVDLDGDFRNGGFGVAVSLGYERLVGSAADTPIVAMRGSPDQFSALFGVGYVF